MSQSSNEKTNPLDTGNDMLLTSAAVLLGAAAGSKIADEIIGGAGLPSALAQIGGAILGSYCGMKFLKTFKEI